MADQEITIELEPFWNFTSDVWINCSECNFRFLIPLVAMVGKKPENLKIKENKKSLISFIGHLLKKRYPNQDSGERLFGFAWSFSKFCKNCKSLYIAKTPNRAIKLEPNYWEKFSKDPMDFDSEFRRYLDSQNKDIDLLQENKCDCGNDLIVVNKTCPLCSKPIMLSARDIDGLPIMTFKSG